MKSTKVTTSIVVAVDGSTASLRAVAWAAREAAQRSRPLALLHVNTWPSYMASDWPDHDSWDVEGGRSIGRDVLAQATRAALDVAPDLEVRGDIVEGQPARSLVEHSCDTSMLVVGRRGRGEVATLLLGSVTAQVATYASGVVVVVPESGQAAAADGPGVVLGVDIGDFAQPAIAFAFEQASQLGVPLTAVRAWTFLSDEPAIRTQFPHPDDLASDQRRLLSEAMAGWSEKYPEVEVRRRLVRRHAGRALIDEARDAALLVVGARGAGGFRGLVLGSVSDTVIRGVACPVAVVR